MNLELASSTLVGFCLALVRTAAWISICPPFNSPAVPRRVRVGLATAMAFAITHTIAPVVPVTEAPSPRVPGVPPEVQRVLVASGNAERLGLDQLSELPPEVARVLIHYGMTLTIATDRGGEG